MNVTVLPENEITKELVRWADKHPTIEVCGYVYGHGVVPIANVARDPSTYFEMDPHDVMWAHETYGFPYAIYHSHPSGCRNPSEADVLGAPPNLIYLIVARGRVHRVDW